MGAEELGNMDTGPLEDQSSLEGSAAPRDAKAPAAPAAAPAPAGVDQQDAAPAGPAAGPVLPPAPPARELSAEERVDELQRRLAHLRGWMGTVASHMAATNPQLAKNARRLYIGGIPADTSEEELYQFFSALMAGCGAALDDGQAVSSCKITSDKGYAFLELRCAEEASNAMAFDGVKFKDANLKIRRPSNYDAAAALLLAPPGPDPTISVAHLTMCRTVVEDSWSKVFVGGLPSDWTDDQVKELLAPYGELKSFNLVMDKATGKSKGYCFCEFEDDASVDGVIAGLHMKNLNRKMLTVKRALDGPGPHRSNSGGSEGGSMGSRRGSGGIPLGAASGGAAGGGAWGGAGRGEHGAQGGGVPAWPPGGRGNGMLFGPQQAAAAAATAAAQQHGGPGGPYPMAGLPPPPPPAAGGRGAAGKAPHDATAAAAMGAGMVMPGMFGFGPHGGYPQMLAGHPHGMNGGRQGPIQPPPLRPYTVGPGQLPPHAGAPAGPAGAGAAGPSAPRAPLGAAAAAAAAGQPAGAQPPPAPGAPPAAPGAGGPGSGGHPGYGPNGPGPLPATSSLPGGVAGQEGMGPPAVPMYPGGGPASDAAPAGQQGMGGPGADGGAPAGGDPAAEAFSPHRVPPHHQQPGGFMAPQLASVQW